MKTIGRFFFLTGIIGIILVFFVSLISLSCSGSSTEKVSLCEDNDNQITLLVILKAKVGMEEKLKSELTALLAPTRKEAGCINYDMHTDSQDNSRFMFYENWACQSALDSHLSSSHNVQFAEKMEDLLAEPVEITFWEVSK